MSPVLSNMEQTTNATRAPVHSFECAANNVDKFLISDNSAPNVFDIMNVNMHTGSTASGLSDQDYPSLSGLPLALSSMTQIKTLNKVPLPPEIMEHFGHMQSHCMMGLFTEIRRAWLTIDSDIYVWTYEEGADVAYFDGLGETITSVGLVKPKPGVFHTFIRYLLVLTTAADIVVLGVTFTAGPSNELEEIQLVPDPVFTMPTDGSTITTIAGSSTGRLFLGTKEGCLYEITYQAESSWFGKRCKKVNHSTSALSFLVPSFLNAALGEEHGIVQISIDDSRHILYVLTEKGSIEVYDMGEQGNSFTKIAKVSQATLVHQAMNTVKTLDSQNFRPIVNISAVEAEESGFINLVAISQTGVRFYFAVVGLTNLQPNQRPYTLTLLHVRLPPGYSASMTTRPRMVHMANYREGNLLLLSTVNEKDVVWCLSSDLFPFNNTLMEAYTTISLDGPAWAMAEVRLTDHLYNPPLQQSPPLIIRQHYEPPKKYVVLTAQGAHIFVKLRPVDVLKQLLQDSRGPESEFVKAFFMILKEDQACASSLILACLDSIQNPDISDWATRAFFIYGGEPSLAPPPSLNQTNPFTGSSIFLPNIVSTPVTAHSQLRQQQSAQSPLSPLSPSQGTMFASHVPFIFSAKHNSLYLYLGRILRPLWNFCCVEKLMATANKTYLISTMSVDSCQSILTHLTALRSFLLRNSQLSLSYNVGQPPTADAQTSTVIKTNQTVQDAQLEERQNLDSLKLFVNHCCQVLGLWKILCEHQFHILVNTLPVQYQQILLNTTFKDLLLYGQEICCILIGTLVNSYLGDNASVDSISNKLRDICPDLYKYEDAAFTKASELLKTAKNLHNVNEKEELLANALQLCKNVAPNLNLHEICQQFTELSAYHAVIDICVSCIKKIDPDNVAEHYYKAGPQEGNPEYFPFYAKRMDIYKEVLLMLNTIYSQSNQTALSPKPDAQNTLQLDTNVVVRQVLNDILQNSDQLLHVTVYEWMMSKQMTADLIKVTESSLETYLLHASKQNPENMAALDLLWKYYESNNNHASAAKILNMLANKTCPMLTLKDRITYMARAVMCMRSDHIGYAPYLGVFLRELEDKVDIAKVQERILDAIICLRGVHPDAEEAVAALNLELYEVTQLYEDFADPFDLWECKLAIIECAGYSDASLIETIWHNILQTELKKSRGSDDNRMMQLLSKVQSLAKLYLPTVNCFPTAFIVEELEIISAKLKAEPRLVPSVLVSMDRTIIQPLINIYSKMLTVSSFNKFWSSSEDKLFHLYESFAALVDVFLQTHELYNSVDKRKIIGMLQDVTAALLSALYSKPNTATLVTVVRNVKARLERL